MIDLFKFIDCLSVFQDNIFQNWQCHFNWKKVKSNFICVANSILPHSNIMPFPLWRHFPCDAISKCETKWVRPFFKYIWLIAFGEALLWIIGRQLYLEFIVLGLVDENAGTTGYIDICGRQASPLDLLQWVLIVKSWSWSFPIIINVWNYCIFLYS